MTQTMRYSIPLVATVLFALSACSSATKSFQVTRVEAYGFMRCADTALRTQLRYQVKQKTDTTIYATRKVGSETGSMSIKLHGMPKSPVIEVIPDKVPDSDRDALLKRCSEWTS